MTAPAKPTTGGKKTKKVVESEGIAHIAATFNNVLITITGLKGNALAWGTAGKAGFKGSKKSTPFAATVDAEYCGRGAVHLGLRGVDGRGQVGGRRRQSGNEALASDGVRV